LFRHFSAKIKKKIETSVTLQLTNKVFFFFSLSEHQTTVTGRGPVVVLLLAEFCCQQKTLQNDSAEFRVARWFIFEPKIPIWVNFGGP
jgi:hypothetical protein